MTEAIAAHQDQLAPLSYWQQRYIDVLTEGRKFRKIVRILQDEAPLPGIDLIHEGIDRWQTLTGIQYFDTEGLHFSDRAEASLNTAWSVYEGEPPRLILDGFAEEVASVLKRGPRHETETAFYERLQKKSQTENGINWNEEYANVTAIMLKGIEAVSQEKNTAFAKSALDDRIAKHPFVREISDVSVDKTQKPMSAFEQDVFKIFLDSEDIDACLKTFRRRGPASIAIHSFTLDEAHGFNAVFSIIVGSKKQRFVYRGPSGWKEKAKAA